MNPRIWFFGFCLVAFGAAVPSKVFAQGCVTFSNDYAEYDDESSDGTNITVDIIMDGSGTMTINRSLPGCGALPGDAVHTPVINSNITASPSGKYVGGTVTGSGQCADCYLSAENTQIIPIGSDTSWEDDWYINVLCSVGGQAWGDGGQIGIGLHRATYEAEPAGTGCQFTLTCPAGTRAVCGTSSYSSPTPCQAPWLNLLFVSVTYNRSGTLSCFGISPNQWSATQGTCD